MKKTKFLSTLLFSLFLVGCGGTSEDTPTEKPGTDPVDTSKPTEVVTEEKPTEAPTPAGTFVMEAEYTYITGKQGNGYSGSSTGKEMVQKDETGAGASNGYWLGYLYRPNMTVDFEFTSDKAVDDVTLTLRLSCEIKDIVLTSNNYKIHINGEEVTDYGTITLSGAPTSDSTGYVRPFTDFKCKKKISIKEGKNTLVFTTANSDVMAGTMVATAPMFDCVKLSTFGDANLDYEPITDNLSLFEE